MWKVREREHDRCKQRGASFVVARPDFGDKLDWAKRCHDTIRELGPRPRLQSTQCPLLQLAQAELRETLRPSVHAKLYYDATTELPDW